MLYQPHTWVDEGLPGETPIHAVLLNDMEAGIQAAGRALAPGWEQQWFGGALRNYGASGGYWKTIDDGAHWPWNISQVKTNTLSIDVYYDFETAGIGTVLVSPDETLSAHGWKAGASVEGDKCSIKLNRHRTIADQIRYDGSAWVSTTRMMAPVWSSSGGGQLILTHPRVYGHSYSIVSRGRLIANMSASGAADPGIETRVVFYDPAAAGAQVAAPSTDMRVYVTRSDANNGAAINPQAAPDQVELPNSNIWILGVQHTGPRPD